MKYYVYNPDGRMPKHQHNTYNEALQEASRLALKEMSPMFIIQIRAKVCPQYSCEVVDFKEK